MVVICNMNCPYRSKNGFCRRRVISIENGGCGYLQKGMRKEEPLYFDGYVPKQPQEEEKKPKVLEIEQKEEKNDD